MRGDVRLGEEKPENAVAHVRGQAGDLAAIADKSGGGSVLAGRVVVFVLLWCVGEDNRSFLRRVQENPNAVLRNAGKVKPNEQAFVLEHLKFHKPFWTIRQKLVVYRVKPFCNRKTPQHIKGKERKNEILRFGSEEEIPRDGGRELRGTTMIPLEFSSFLSVRFLAR